MNTEEKVLLATTAGVSALLLVRATQYDPTIGLFPKVAAGLTIFFGIAIVVGKRSDLFGQSEIDIIGQVNEKTELDDQTHSSGSASGETRPQIGKADPGEFRIDKPVTTYQVPYTGHVVTHRATVSAMVILYLALLWLSGVFVSSVAFLLMYAKVVGLRRNVFIGLLLFTVCSLLVFGFWLETPLFRPGHDLSRGLGV
jgi:hypothetical protein